MRGKVLIFTAILMLGAGMAMADTLAVNNAAAMGGSGTACGGSNCGLEVTHDNSSRAYVEDTTPAEEETYRANFLFNPQSTTTSSNFRQTIMTVTTLNPGHANCAATTFTSMARLFYYRTGGAGQNASILMTGNGNQCGERPIDGRISINDDEEVRICIEIETGNSLSGKARIAVVDAASSCPASGAYPNERDLTNGNLAVNRIRMGTPQTNNFGAGETATLYFDEFESFRTIAGE